MVDITKDDKLGDGASSKSRGPAKSQQLSKLYSLPAPIRTFPLPTFLPHNPISLLQLLYTWVSQTVYPPNSVPETPYQGWLSVETRSIHVTDQRSIRALWEQGFYGKGSLSRSEPSWLDREKRRQGAAASKTSEEVTRQRRLERQQVKWERARRERETIDKTLLEERGGLHQKDEIPPEHSLHFAGAVFAPVGPLELLALPNSERDLKLRNDFSIPNGAFKQNLPLDETSTFRNVEWHGEDTSHSVIMNGVSAMRKPPVMDGEMQDAFIENGNLESRPENHHNGTISGDTNGNISSNGDIHINGSTSAAHDSEDSSKSPKRRKSVRFSPTVERTTFIQSEPPSPDLAATLTKFDEPPLDIENQEHLQLTMEEALFLNYGLGVLKVYDPNNQKALSTEKLFAVCRQTARSSSSDVPLHTADDPFMVSYVVYHHFRSLGWVVRGGIKFSVDYLLYNRGPVFSHAEFAVMILPSYSDPFWSSDPFIRDYVAEKEKKSWSWLHCVNRVNSQVKKTLILVYVDIPVPLSVHAEAELGIDGVLQRYKVREIVLKRWLSNRSRD